MAYKDGFVIEYTHQGGRVSCYKCVYFDKGDKSCNKTGVYVPDVAYEKWKKSAYFELEGDWDTDAMRMKAERARAIAQGKKKPKKKKKQQKASPSSGDKGKPKPKPQPVAGVKMSAKDKRQKKKEAWKQVERESENAMMLGLKVTSPKYGRGKVVGVEGEYVTVAFAKDSKRVRFKVDMAMEKGSLSFL